MTHRIGIGAWCWGLLITVGLGVCTPLSAQTPRFLDHIVSYRLANGLRVVLAPDSSARHASVELWLASGTIHDPRGQRGTAHLLEHVSAALAAPVDTIGRRQAQPLYANSNAQVRRDHARYFLLVDPSALDAALATHAARLALDRSTITDSIVRQHADIVVNEGRGEGTPITEGVQPYWRLQTGTYGDTHPYGLIGESETSVRSITAADLRAFAESHAAVGDALLLVVGAFDVPAARARIAARFGALPARAGMSARRWRELPPAQSLRRDMQRATSGPSRITRRFALPPLGDPALEHAEVALRMAAARWHQHGATFRQAPRVSIEPGMLASDLTIDAEVTHAERVDGSVIMASSRALDSALAAVARGDTAALTDARADATAALLTLHDALGFQRSRTEQLGEATFFTGDPNVARVRLRRLQRVTRTEAMRAAADWLVGRGYELALVATSESRPPEGTLPTNAPMVFGTSGARTIAETHDTTVHDVRFIVTPLHTLPVVRISVVSDSAPVATRQRATGSIAQLWTWLAGLRPQSGATVYVEGDITPSSAVNALSRATHGWLRTTKTGGLPAVAVAPLTPGVRNIPAPGRVQTQLRIELRIPSATPADEIALRVLRKRLTAALNTRLRTERRWSYGANSTVAVEGDSSRLTMLAEVQSDRVRESLQEAEAVVRAFADGTLRLPDHQVLAEEIRQELLLDHATLASIEGSLRADLAAGRTVHWRSLLLARVATTNAEDVARARRLADWSRMTITLTGDPQTLPQAPSGR
ncbi:M16 family metallopeptidase [Gemmatimonas aurantiaca]|nr:insulinase family protein [Gemmatimonas aurantiaca]